MILAQLPALRQNSSGCRECAHGHTFCLSPGQVHDAPVGRQLLLDLGPLPVEVPLVVDRAYEGDETRQLVMELNMIPVLPPKSNRKDPWDYDRALYKKRNEVERLCSHSSSRLCDSVNRPRTQRGTAHWGWA